MCRLLSVSKASCVRYLASSSGQLAIERSKVKPVVERWRGTSTAQRFGGAGRGTTRSNRKREIGNPGEVKGTDRTGPTPKAGRFPFVTCPRWRRVPRLRALAKRNRGGGCCREDSQASEGSAIDTPAHSISFRDFLNPRFISLRRPFSLIAESPTAPTPKHQGFATRQPSR